MGGEGGVEVHLGCSYCEEQQEGYAVELKERAETAV